MVIVADLRAMADQLPAEAQRIRGISCLGLALDGSTYLTRHSFEQIGERNPTLEDLSHPAWQWDEQAVQSTNQRMEGLAINALLVQLYQPELLTTTPAAKVPSGRGFSAVAADEDGNIRPQGPVWIGKDFRIERSPRSAPNAPSPGTAIGTPRKPTGAVGTGIRCCTGKNARCGGCNGFSRSMWGSVESADSQKMTAALMNNVPPSDIAPSIHSATRSLLRPREDLP